MNIFTKKSKAISKMVLAALTIISTIFLLLTTVFANTMNASAMEHSPFELGTASKITNLVEQTSLVQRVPGISVAVINDGNTQFIQTGYADTRVGIKADQNTFYKLGSVSKAFTGLGVLLLEYMGYLSLYDPINYHITWLNFSYNNICVTSDIRILDLLHHTSGFTLANHSLTLPLSGGNNALLETVQRLNNMPLDFAPTTRFGYASANYILAGFLIQEVSGMSFESFMYSYVLAPLGMHSTFMFMGDAHSSATGIMAIGYKPGWFTSIGFTLSEFRSHTPTGYIISSASDIARWLNFHLYPASAPAPFNQLISRQHIPNTQVEPTNGNFYGIGWNISEDSRTIRHAGGNPNFVTELIFLPQEGIAVAVLMNSVSGSPGNLARNIINIIIGENYTNILPASELVLFDNISSVLSIILIVAMIVLLVFLILNIIKLLKGELVRSKPSIKHWMFIGGTILLTIVFLTITFLIPSIFGYASWTTTLIWAPSTIPVVFALLCSASFLLTVFAVFKAIFKRKLIE